MDHTITVDLRLKLTELVDHVVAKKLFENLPLALNLEFKGVSFKTYTGFRYTLEHSMDSSTWPDAIDSAAGDSSMMKHFSAPLDAAGFWRLSRD